MTSIPTQTTSGFSVLQDLLRPYLPPAHVQSLIHKYLDDKIEELAQPVLQRLASWNDYESSFQVIKERLNQNPEDKTALDELVDFIYMRTEQREISTFTPAVVSVFSRINLVDEYFSDYIHVQMRLATLHNDKEIHPINRGDAEQFLRRAVALDPKHAVARTNLGIVLAMQERWEEAETELLEALRLFGDKADIFVYNPLAQVSCKLGKYEEAEKYLNLIEQQSKAAADTPSNE